jgi:hypothetical protein
MIVTIFGGADTNGQPVTLLETVSHGLFRGFIALAAPSDTPVAGQLQVNDGDHIRAEYFDASSKNLTVAAAVIDTQKPVLSALTVVPEVESALVQWSSSKSTDALVQYGESTFLGRTAYRSELATRHALKLESLTPDHDYYFQVVNRDAAGNVAIDNNQNQFYSFHTGAPRLVPWSDDMETGATNWTVVQDESSSAVWQLGVPANGRETNAHSLTNAWGSNLSGAAIDSAYTALVSPVLLLSGKGSATLRFWHSYAFDASGDLDMYELGQVNISTNNGLTWRVLMTYTNASDGWEPAELDLTTYLGNVIRLEWFYGYSTFEAKPRPGWLVDDVSVTVATPTHGLVMVTNNLSQARFTVSGPAYRSGQGWSLSISNVPVGTYTVTFKPVLYYDTPPPQTSLLTATNTLVFTGAYTCADTNANQVPDVWESHFFGAPVTYDLTTTDTDGDGLTDYEEFIAGTDPTRADSVLRFYPPQMLSSGELQLEWPTTSGRAYRVSKSVDAQAWTPCSDWLRANNSLMTLMLTPPPNNVPNLFRLEVKP